MEQRKVFIATPTVGFVHAEFCASLAGAMRHLHSRGVEVHYSSVDGSVPISDKRDWLAREFMRWSEATHLLFIDSDMTFKSDLAYTLLGFGKDVIGAIYPERRVNLDAYGAAVEKGEKPENALAKAYKFLFLPDDEGRIAVRGDLCRVGAIPTGFMLISRTCIERLLPSVETYESFAGDPVAGLFARIHQPGAKTMGTDYSFCRRWRDAGGEVWAYTRAEIWHCGTMRYGMPFERYLVGAYGHPDKGPKQ